MDAQRRTALIFVTPGVGCASCMCDWGIRYVKGETNFVADALSLSSVSAIRSDTIIKYKELSEDYASTRLRYSTSSTLDFQLLKSFDNVLIWCDVSTGHARPYITAKF